MTITFARLCLDKKLLLLRTLSSKKKNLDFFQLVDKLRETNPIVSVWNNGQVVLRSDHDAIFGTGETSTKKGIVN